MTILRMSESAAIFILVVMLIRSVLIHKLPKKTFIVLWFTALLLLLVPASVPSQFSIYSLMNTVETVDNTENIQAATEDIRITDYEFITEALNNYKTQTQPAQTVTADMVVPEKTVHISPVFLIWIVGFSGCILFFTVVHLRFRKEYNTALPHENDYLTKWQKQHEIKRRMQIRISDKISIPLTYGLLKPVILLPKTINFNDTKRLEYILAHEYVHIRNFDTLKKYMLAAALSIHWFNPFVWLMYVLFNRDIELCCDETVVRKYGKYEKSAYAKALIGLEEIKSGFSPLCNSFNKNSIEERIISIMKIKKTSTYAVIMALVIVISTITVFATSAESEETTSLPTVEASANSSNADISVDESSASTISEIPDVVYDNTAWPTDLLPTGFPEITRDEIYSVKQENGELIITMFGDVLDKVYYFDTLIENGWRGGRCEEYELLTCYLTLYREDGWRCVFFEQYNEGGLENHLSDIVSSTGYTFELRVKQVEVDPEIFIDRVFPSTDTDLGLAEITFTEWPSEYLPENFPTPFPSIENGGYGSWTIVSMEQKSNGVFITLTMDWEAYWRYNEAIRTEAGFIYGNSSVPAFAESNPSFNKNLDYVYQTGDMEYESEKGENVLVTLQIVRSDCLPDD